MRIVVQGLWHLGAVTAACCARHFNVIGLDFDPAVVDGLNRGQAPILEPGLNERLADGLSHGSLRFTTAAKDACTGADLLWLCADTPVNDRDESDVAAVLDALRRALPHLPPHALVLISSQLPVGTCASLEREFPGIDFACSPENLRLGKALAAFEEAERIVIGLRNPARRAQLEKLCAPFTRQVLFMRTESAEMVKHALNSFLALSVTFINEVARLCELTGADAREVSAGLKSEPRIGPRAYLLPGVPFAGGTLARDVVTLTKIGANHHESLALIPAIKEGNDLHRRWIFRKLQARLGDFHGRTIAVLGLVYTPNTNTLRRSAAVELCQELVSAGARVRAFDPAIQAPLDALPQLEIASYISAALHQADTAVVCTEWPEFRQADWPTLIAAMRRPLVIDPNRFLEAQLALLPDVDHASVGR